MGLRAGSKVGPYEIVAPIGAGGMGEVYRARDTRLDRDVAIKILPPAFAADAERLARFEREARTLASLNHAAIAAIYGVEDRALIMELVEGETLADRLRRGALPVDEALAITRQIANALEAAHEKGIVHRDLKPANVMITRDGDVKVLDFGLAKAGDAGRDVGTGGDFMNSPTITSPATQLGTILGTAAYMSPEQAKGRPADRRSDVWALGCVLFEMLTARRAFEGDDMSDTLAAVLRGEPDWSALPPAAPPHVRLVIQQCLSRDRKARIPEVSVVRYLLDGSGVTMAALSSASAATHPSRVRRLLPLAAAAVLGAAIIAAAGWALLDRADPPRMRFAIENIQVPRSHTQSPVALSPDGRYLAYAGAPHASAVNVIYVRPLDQGTARALPGTEGAVMLFWSPDSRFIGFVARGMIRKVPVTGGPPQDVVRAGGAAASGTWGSAGEIVFSAGPLSNTRLYRVPEDGGGPTELLAPDGTHYTSFRAPLFLPDGRRFLFFAWSTDPAKRAIMASSLDGGAPVVVGHADTQPVLAYPGFLLYGRSGTLFAHVFDAKRARLTGEPIPIAEDLQLNLLLGQGAFTASQTGLLAYLRGGSVDAARSLVWIDRVGKPLGSAGQSDPHDQVRLSPDGKRVALAMPDLRTGTMTLAVLDLASQIKTPMSLTAGANDPAWMPGSEIVLFEMINNGKRDLFTMAAGGRDPVLQFGSPEDPKWLDDVSRDGRYALYHRPPPAKLYAVELTGPADKRTARVLFEHAGSVDGAHFSPDGKWIAYMSDETGGYEVWVAAFPAFDRRRKISSGGGGQPMWRGDGRELFYLTPGGTMMAATLTYGPGGSIDIAAPSMLFKSPIAFPNLTLDQYGVTGDGQRFLMIQPGRAREDARPAIHVLVNWASGLRRDSSR